ARAKNFRGTVAPKDGMGAVISGLEGYLKRQGVQFSYGKPISATEITQLRKSQPVVAALSANAALKVAGTEGRVAEVLSKIEMLPLVSATFFFEQTDKRSLGFGVLFPAQERRAALGVLKNDFIFDYRANIGLHSETWILGGANDPSVISLNDEQIRDRVLRERNAVFHLTDAPTSMRVTRWPTALPHYTTELESDISAIQGIHENLALVGNYLGSIGLSQIVVRLKSLPKTLADEGKWS
ncbi:MAG TPA: hypothetical protein VM432_13605, partial [Bdellovibrionales bacterium]|nr:hypothetical protein [Bdellovibrionales bacterium]